MKKIGMVVSEQILLSLRARMETYAPLSDETWYALSLLCRVTLLKKGEVLYRLGELPEHFGFVFSGLIRGYVMNEQGQEYNKNFFPEDTFPGSMTALLTETPSVMAFDAIEDTTVVEINFSGFRKLLFDAKDLMAFQIHYLEKNWLLHKDTREIALVQEDAEKRYMLFTRQHPLLTKRLPLYQIASHLGITPTQLSRIRKKHKLG